MFERNTLLNRSLSTSPFLSPFLSLSVFPFFLSPLSFFLAIVSHSLWTNQDLKSADFEWLFPCFDPLEWRTHPYKPIFTHGQKPTFLGLISATMNIKTKSPSPKPFTVVSNLFRCTLTKFFHPSVCWTFANFAAFSNLAKLKIITFHVCVCQNSTFLRILSLHLILTWRTAFSRLILVTFRSSTTNTSGLRWTCEFRLMKWLAVYLSADWLIDWIQFDSNCFQVLFIRQQKFLC